MQEIVKMLEQIFPDHKVRHDGKVAKVTIEEVTLRHMGALIDESLDRNFPKFDAKVRRSGPQITLIVTAL